MIIMISETFNTPCPECEILKNKIKEYIVVKFKTYNQQSTYILDDNPETEQKNLVNFTELITKMKEYEEYFMNL